MDISPLLKGILIGFSIAAPIGAISILLIRRTLAYGLVSGLISGLGAATADGLYGIVAAFGLSFISDFIVGQQFWFRLIGSLFLLYLGVRTLLSNPKEGTNAEDKQGLFGTYTSTLFLTITNPMTVIAYGAVIAGFGVSGNDGMFLPAALLVSGIIMGSFLWALILCGGINILRSKFNLRALRFVNRVSGLILIAFAIWIFINMWKG